MKTAEEIKRGDYVEIIPNEDHTTYIKGHYGKSHKVTRVTIWKGLKYYKLKGIKGNGPESSIKKINKVGALRHYRQLLKE